MNNIDYITQANKKRLENLFPIDTKVQINSKILNGTGKVLSIEYPFIEVLTQDKIVLFYENELNILK